MKPTGVVRKIDELGRIVLPSELRQSMDIQVRDALEIFTEEDRIILKKYHPGCIFCGNMEEVRQFCDKRVCAACIAKMKAEF